GMYLGGKKCGWLVEHSQLGKHDGKDVLRVSSELYMVTQFDGEKSGKEEKTLICYELTGTGTIVFASQHRKEDGKEVSQQAVRHGKGLRITTRQRGRTIHRDVPLPKDTLAVARGLEAWLRGSRKPAEKYTRYSLAWEDSDVDQKEIYCFK